ncbi:unnamed protein product [Rotaria socialis]|uniref:Uncharacterized protein n=1 Tax=Rotaria socialis TaxID=392032 RepID=A0A821DEA1_9BILA|nr:unnamed protein product [Rotaria socialis]CAF3415657.1 unnamed protein product [Rotaria socialis]CAF3486383.1 unnamed protein product [Rotaria socialis]CAF4401592.1 unnamed protein product [Rotaria socialis]CAF4445161.1 unnamed protein product [Rotaria socialis]
MKLILFVITILLILNKFLLINGLPATICTPPIALYDTSNATTVVGNGASSSCNETALAIALSLGGIITFNCSLTGQPVTIDIHNQLNVSRATDTIIDGGGIITLNGLGLTRILNFNLNNFLYDTPVLTVQRLTFVNGHCQDSNGGCAIFQANGGTTVVINSIFENNVGPVVGQDTAGGAIWTIGGGTTTIIGSMFLENQCSNGGGLGILGSGLIMVNSYFQGNQATGNGGNPGNGGNGGAISFDGLGRNNSICGTRFTGNQGNKFGGAFFRVAYNGSERNDFNQVIVDNNWIPAASNGLAGGLYIQGSMATITYSSIVGNAASGAGGIFFANQGLVILNSVSLIGNQAYTGLGAALSCTNPVSGTFTNLIVANNYAGAFAAAFAGCSTTITLSNTVIANNTVGNPWPANACSTPMSDGSGVVQSPIGKQAPASGQDALCTNGSVIGLNNVTVILNETNWQIQVIGAQSSYMGPSSNLSVTTYSQISSASSTPSSTPSSNQSSNQSSTHSSAITTFNSSFFIHVISILFIFFLIVRDVQ